LNTAHIDPWSNKKLNNVYSHVLLFLHRSIHSAMLRKLSKWRLFSHLRKRTPPSKLDNRVLCQLIEGASRMLEKLSSPPLYSRILQSCLLWLFSIQSLTFELGGSQLWKKLALCDLVLLYPMNVRKLWEWSGVLMGLNYISLLCLDSRTWWCCYCPLLVILGYTSDACMNTVPAS
jgi:hypothetical protein